MPASAPAMDRVDPSTLRAYRGALLHFPPGSTGGSAASCEFVADGLLVVHASRIEHAGALRRPRAGPARRHDDRRPSRPLAGAGLRRYPRPLCADRRHREQRRAVAQLARTRYVPGRAPLRGRGARARCRRASRRPRASVSSSWPGASRRTIRTSTSSRTSPRTAPRCAGSGSCSPGRAACRIRRLARRDLRAFAAGCRGRARRAPVCGHCRPARREGRGGAARGHAVRRARAIRTCALAYRLLDIRPVI